MVLFDLWDVPINILCNVIWKLPVTVQDIKSKSENDKFIAKIKEMLKVKVNKNRYNSNVNHCSLCYNVLKCTRKVVVAAAPKKHVLMEFHKGHLGISRRKSVRRGYMYWLTMDHDIEQGMKSCRGCFLTVKAPLMKFQLCPETDNPWSQLHIDFAGQANSMYYLIILDSLEVYKRN